MLTPIVTETKALSAHAPALTPAERHYARRCAFVKVNRPVRKGTR